MSRLHSVSGRSVVVVFTATAVASLLFTRCSFFGHSDTTTTPPPAQNPTSVPSTPPPTEPSPPAVSSTSSVPTEPVTTPPETTPKPGTGTVLPPIGQPLPPGQQPPPIPQPPIYGHSSSLPFFPPIGQHSSIPPPVLPPPIVFGSSSSHSSSLFKLPKKHVTKPVSRPRKPVVKSSSASGLWTKVENASWHDAWGNVVALRDGKVQWSDDDGQTWSPSDGSWEGDKGVFYKISASFALLSATNPRQGPWTPVAAGVWMSDGKTFKVEAPGTIFMKK